MLKISGSNPGKTDEELLGTYHSSGSLDILGELYARYMHLVYGVALKYLGGPEDAKDAVMQIFEKLITELSNHEIKNFRSWLYVLAKNHCLMDIRSQKSKWARIEGWKSEQFFMEHEQELHPLDREDSTLQKALQDCLEGLKVEQKQCIDLFYYKKKCYREIAEQLNMKEKKIKSYLQNGKRNLKICLEAKNVTGKEI